MSEDKIKNRRLTLGDLFEFAKERKLSLDCAILMRPENEEVFLVNGIGSGTLTDENTGDEFPIVLLDGFGAKNMKKEKIH